MAFLRPLERHSHLTKDAIDFSNLISRRQRREQRLPFRQSPCVLAEHVQASIDPSREDRGEDGDEHYVQDQAARDDEVGHAVQRVGLGVSRVGEPLLF